MIAILLATYNGARFLGEQLDSLFRQTYTDFTVYVHDDGSTDATCEILHQYASAHPGKLVLMSDEKPGRGPMGSFMWLLENTDAEYYMFCDQDDVWLETKIEHTLRRMRDVERLHPGKPVLIHTDLRVVDERLNTRYESFWKRKGYRVDVSKRFNFTCLGNVFTGCTILINQALKQISLPVSPHAKMHDQWLGIVAAKYGVVENLKEQTLLYRQHGMNAAGAGTDYSWTHWFTWWMAFPRWYRANRPLLREVGYGPAVKVYWYKLLYVIIRLS